MEALCVHEVCPILCGEHFADAVHLQDGPCVVLDGLSMQPLRTADKGGCSLHALYGDIRYDAQGRPELRCEDVRTKLDSALPVAWDAVCGLVANETSLQDVMHSWWWELLLPAIRCMLGLVAETTVCKEAALFHSAVIDLSPQLGPSLQLFVSEKSRVDSRRPETTRTFVDSASRLCGALDPVTLRLLGSVLNRDEAYLMQTPYVMKGSLPYVRGTDIFYVPDECRTILDALRHEKACYHNLRWCFFLGVEHDWHRVSDVVFKAVGSKGSAAQDMRMLSTAALHLVAMRAYQLGPAFLPTEICWAAHRTCLVSPTFWLSLLQNCIW